MVSAWVGDGGGVWGGGGGAGVSSSGNAASGVIAGAQLCYNLVAVCEKKSVRLHMPWHCHGTGDHLDPDGCCVSQQQPMMLLAAQQQRAPAAAGCLHPPCMASHLMHGLHGAIDKVVHCRLLVLLGKVSR